MRTMTYVMTVLAFAVVGFIPWSSCPTGYSKTGPWTFYLGYSERWLQPRWHSSLIPNRCASGRGRDPLTSRHPLGTSSTD
jgi:hypothetical protein